MTSRENDLLNVFIFLLPRHAGAFNTPRILGEFIRPTVNFEFFFFFAYFSAIFASHEPFPATV